jgi:hypothetical protein
MYDGGWIDVFDLLLGDIWKNSLISLYKTSLSQAQGFTNPLAGIKPPNPSAFLLKA